MNENINKEELEELKDYYRAYNMLENLCYEAGINKQNDIYDTMKDALSSIDILIIDEEDNKGISPVIRDKLFIEVDKENNKNNWFIVCNWFIVYNLIAKEAKNDRLTETRKKALENALPIMEPLYEKAMLDSLYASYEGGKDAYDKLSDEKKKTVRKEFENRLADEIRKERKPQKKETPPKQEPQDEEKKEESKKLNVEIPSELVEAFRKYCADNGIIINNQPRRFRVVQKANKEKATADAKKKISLKNFTKLLPKAFNIDVRVEHAVAQMDKTISEKQLEIKKDVVNFAKDVKCHYTEAKSFVTSLPKKTKESIKKFFEDKKQISRLTKEEKMSKKDAMEQVYEEKKDKHLDYKIVNRWTNFKEGTCQKIETRKGQIIDIGKDVVKTIKKPFDYLRNNYRNDEKREELIKATNELRLQKNKNVSQRKKIKVNPDIGGYIGTTIIVVMGFLLLAGAIFMTVGSLVNK